MTDLDVDDSESKLQTISIYAIVSLLTDTIDFGWLRGNYWPVQILSGCWLYASRRAIAHRNENMFHFVARCYA